MSFAALLAVALAIGAARQDPAPKHASPASKPPEHHWLVTLGLTKLFDPSKAPQDHFGFPEHIANVHRLAAEGTLAVGGPLLEDFATGKPTGAIYVVLANTADAARKLVAADPIVTNGLAEIASVRAFVPGAGAWLQPAKRDGR